MVTIALDDKPEALLTIRYSCRSLSFDRQKSSPLDLLQLFMKWSRFLRNLLLEELKGDVARSCGVALEERLQSSCGD